MPCCRFHPNRAGEWFYPNGTVVEHQAYGTVIYRNRGYDDGTVNLNRANDVMSPTGLFCCVVPDATGTNQTVCANIGKLIS